MADVIDFPGGKKIPDETPTIDGTEMVFEMAEELDRHLASTHMRYADKLAKTGMPPGQALIASFLALVQANLSLTAEICAVMDKTDPDELGGVMTFSPEQEEEFRKTGLMPSHKDMFMEEYQDALDDPDVFPLITAHLFLK